MAAGTPGRKVSFTWGGVAIPGVRQKNLSVAGAPIDITSDDDAGWRTLLTDPTVREIGITLSGVTKSPQLKTDFFNGDTTKTGVLTYPDGSILSGQFYLSSYKDNGPYNDAMTFDADIMSTGAVSFTPGS